MNLHASAFQIHIQDAVLDCRKKKFLSAGKFNYIYVICPCFQYILHSAKNRFFFIYNRKADQICDKVFILF